MKQTAIPLTDEEKANMQLLEITGGILTGVTDPDKLIGSLVLPDGITKIEKFAFSDCSGLTNIVIPNSVKVIADYAFSCCTGLTSIVIPDSVTKIGNNVFSDCSSLIRVIIPDSVTKIGDYVFSNCTHLTELTVDNENPVYCSENNILYTKDKTHLIAAAGGLKGCVVLPDTVTEISPYAFSGRTGLTGITIPAAVAWITECLFSDCSGLKSIVIPDTVTVIDKKAFFRCSSLTSIRIPDSVTKIGDAVFLYCTHLTELTVDNKNPVYCSENNILYTKDKTHLIAAAGGLKGRVVLPDTVTEIADFSFRDCCSLTSVNIPRSVTRINDCAFSGCTGLIELNVDSENPIYYSENNILYTKDKKRLIAAAGGLKGHVVIPDGVEYLGYDVFSSCKNLREIYVPESIERVSPEVFGNGIFDNYKNIAVPNHLSGMFIYNGKARIKYY